MLYPVLQDPLHPIVSSLFDRPRGASIGQMLFGAGEQGAWYDPSDLSTLFQDEAGTTPVTAVEQPVGRILDLSERGNHATQATTTKRPIYSRRVNLLTKTNELTAAPWLPNASSIAPAAEPAPIGGSQAFKLAESNTNALHRLEYTSAATAGAGYKLEFLVKPAGRNRCWVFEDSGSGTAIFDLVAGTYSAVAVGTTASIQPSGDGWWRVSIAYTQIGAISRARIATSSDASTTYLGDGVSGVLVCAPSLTLATDAQLPYQWVNTATDYDADPAKFPAYLRFDGVDDALQTGNIDFTSTDKMTVWAGLTKLSDAAVGVLLEMSVNSVANNGTIGMFTPSGAAGNNIFQRSRGTAQTTASAAAIAPTSFIWTAASIINPPSNAARISGVQVAANTASQGAGNYGNYPLYIGAGAGTSSFFNGRLYSLIVRGAQSSLSQIEATELYTKQKMRLP